MGKVQSVRRGGRRGGRSRKARNSRSNNTRPRKSSRKAREEDFSLSRAAEALARSSVLRKLPLMLRGRLERAVVRRGWSGKTLEQIAEQLSLARYGITAGALKQYARTLDRLIRPVAAAQVAAGVLGCLPAPYRRQVTAGNQVLLLSKVAHVLTHTPHEQMQSSEMVKLAGVLRSAAQRSQQGRKADERKGKPAQDGPGLDFNRFAGAVRGVYGLGWPREGKKSEG